MATTTTISSSTTGSVVGRSTMSLVGAVSPPTTPPATPTSPIMSASDSNKVEDEEVPAIPIDPASSSVKDQKVMATTPPPSPPPASVSAALMPGTPSLTDLDLDALPLKATITTAVLDNGAGHSLSTAIKSERLGSGSGSDVIPSLPSETTTIVASPSPSPSLSSSLPLPSSPSSSLSTAVESAVDVAITVTPPIPTGEATTFFDDMINAPQPPANILTLGPTTSLPDLYHDFFDNHPELYDSGQLSDPEMDLDPEDFASLTTSAMIRARTHTMTDLSQTSGTTM
ncbi:hypothetical protein BX616_004215 [Lobosporangium transversale]|uniref:Uncharacterized protein n=1 Tax=Lobosporangium transversale TaxID=64571 RepID=A0A1Y2GPH0_9FUNG|nr:hypothetical protein BCR41DRAFT_96020 [Lobosporangium transversale]KAF9898309.1 hypothetical protein BX616_004215 [Lobosporangium transversale]ORZ13432.1 hypothetical protein BCR41DRAFT_96020 [Lobosporangium transversale]|eukprot:XP_021880513.1 hypothetical protein BCR41DRAFT_96020 [Lobosporangium transversale]